MSSFAWLDYSEHDRRIALDVIDQFRERETRDELGLGAIRDGFAELFFPGTGTVQTRARYFFFIPWIYQHLEQRRTPSAEVKQRARRLECELIEALLRSGARDGDGVIGRQRRNKLKRLPSSIYWQGLRALGFLRIQASQEQYHRSLDRFYRKGGLELRADDRELLDRSNAFNWNPSIPIAPKKFPAEATLELTTEEAEFLRERITYARPASLYRFLADLPEEPAEVEFPWEHPAVLRAPTQLQDQLAHARNFSEVMHGAPLLYNLILSRLKKNGDWAESYELKLADWRQMISSRLPVLQRWDRDGFWRLVRETGAHVTGPTMRFADQWMEIAMSSEIRRIAKSAAAERLIREREIQLKRAQARVNGGRALDLWEGESGTRRLSYRWGIATRMLRDMYDARPGAD